MPQRPDPAEFERFVLRWQGPVHHLALRMLGDAAEAQDATQEAFLRAFQRFDRYDPARDAGPWIYTVATRVVLNRCRRERPRRKALEARAATPAPVPPPEEPAVERREREEIVADHVGRLPPEERAVVALHYYAGLPQTDVADALAVPRSTVQSRIARALSALRESLASTGSLAVVPSLEDVLRKTAAPPVPEALTRSLLASAARAAARTSSVPLSMIGGLAVSKSVALVLSGVALALLASGYALGRVFAGRGGGDSPQSAAESPEHARLVAENARLKDDLARRLAVAPANSRAAGSLNGAGGAPEAVEKSASSGAAAEADPASRQPVGVDWKRFAAVWAVSYADIAAMMIDDGAREGDDAPGLPPSLTSAQQTKVMELWLEFTKATGKARELSEQPFFDERILPGLVDALFAQELGLPADARAKVEARVKAALEAVAADVKAADERPLARYEARQRVVDQAFEAVEAATPADGREKFVRMETIAREMLLGERDERRFQPEATPGRGTFTDRILAAWREDLTLDEGQASPARPIADAFARDAVAAWRRHEMDRPETHPSPAKRRAFERDVLRLQLEAERALEGVLTPEQRRAAAKAPPRIILPGSGGDVQTRSGSGGI